MFVIKLELEIGSPLSSWPPLMHWNLWLPWFCIPWSCLLCIWNTWYELPWRVFPCNWITDISWGCILYIYKVLLSWIIRPLFLLNCYLGVPLGFLMPSSFQRYWLQPLISKVWDISFIIICNLEVLKGDQLWPNWRFLILSCIHSLKYISNTK